MAALSVALVLALYSAAASRIGNILLASVTAIVALVVAGWVAVTLVPVLARRTPLRFIGYRMEFRITREGWFYLVGIVLVAMAAINTGNNLLFLVLSCLIASILMSGVLSSITLAGVEARLALPEHIFADQVVRGVVELNNEKQTLPSFSLRVQGVSKTNSPDAAILTTPVYFPYIPRRDAVQLSVPIRFPHRGFYQQEALKIVTRFPFGFLQKARRLDLKSEVLVYPSVEATPEFLDVLPGIQGAMESLSKGRGQDLYALRDYQPNDSARHVHWKASARLGSLMVREFSREDDCQVLLVFDPYSAAAAPASNAADKQQFELAVSLCAAIAWSFNERGALLQYRSAGIDVPLAPAAENIFTVLGHLATVQPEWHASEPTSLSEFAADPESFKIIVTAQPRGSIPAEVWNSSYVVFAEEMRA